MFPLFVSDAPVDFSSDDIGNYPLIEYKPGEDNIPVTLHCKFHILRGIEKWKNVTYKIEWFVDGNSVKDPTILCIPNTEKNENDDQCPNRNPVKDELIGKRDDRTGYYKAGQTVS